LGGKRFVKRIPVPPKKEPEALLRKKWRGKQN